MFVDPAVCRTKFERELTDFKAQRWAYHRRGVWLADETFPEVFIVLMAVKSQPTCAVFGVAINFENYDVEPPSVTFVHPVTRDPLPAAQLPHGMPRIKTVKAQNGEPATGPQGEPLFEQHPLVQAEDPQRPGFLCLQGVREYHAHPAHTGDSWWLHRGSGVGRLAHLVNVLATYGVDPVQGVALQITGFNLSLRAE